MIFITGPLFAGKRQAAMELLGWSREELEKKAVWDVQDLAPEAEDLEALARRLSDYPVVIATEVGGGVVPADPAERAAREAAGRLSSAACWRSVLKLLCGCSAGSPPCSRGLWDESVSAASWAHGL